MPVMTLNFAGIEASNIRRSYDDMEEGIYKCITPSVELNSNNNYSFKSQVSEGEYTGAMLSVTIGGDLDKVNDKGQKPNMSFMKTALISHGADAAKLEAGPVNIDPQEWFNGKSCLVYFKPTKRLAGTQYDEHRFVTPEQAQSLLKQLAERSKQPVATAGSGFAMKSGGAQGVSSIPQPKNGAAQNPLLTVPTGASKAADL